MMKMESIEMRERGAPTVRYPSILTLADTINKKNHDNRGCDAAAVKLCITNTTAVHTFYRYHREKEA